MGRFKEEYNNPYIDGRRSVVIDLLRGVAAIAVSAGH